MNGRKLNRRKHVLTFNFTLQNLWTVVCGFEFGGKKNNNKKH